MITNKIQCTSKYLITCKQGYNYFIGENQYRADQLRKSLGIEDKQIKDTYYFDNNNIFLKRNPSLYVHAIIGMVGERNKKSVKSSQYILRQN